MTGLLPSTGPVPARSRGWSGRHGCAAVLLTALVVLGCSADRTTGVGPLVSHMGSTGTCLMTPAHDPVTFGVSWVELTGDRPVTFLGAELRGARGLSVVEGSLLPPGLMPQGTGGGLPFPPTTYLPEPVPAAIWDQRVLPGQEMKPSAEPYPVTVGLRLAPTLDRGTATGVELTYSVGRRRQTVHLPTALMVASRAVYTDCGAAEKASGQSPPVQ